jgi:hypothetical protein
VAGFAPTAESAKLPGFSPTPQELMWREVVEDSDVVDESERRDPNAAGEKAAICWHAAKRRQDFHIMVVIAIGGWRETREREMCR